jgi:hypothetical protein
VGELLGSFVAEHPQVAVKLQVDNTARHRGRCARLQLRSWLHRRRSGASGPGAAAMADGQPVRVRPDRTSIGATQAAGSPSLRRHALDPARIRFGHARTHRTRPVGAARGRNRAGARPERGHQAGRHCRAWDWRCCRRWRSPMRRSGTAGCAAHAVLAVGSPLEPGVAPTALSQCAAAGLPAQS